MKFSDGLYINGEFLEFAEGIYVPDYFCLTSNQDGSTVKMSKNNSKAPTISLETSTDKETWTSYTMDTEITLNEGDKLYWRNTSTTPVSLATSSSKHNYFTITGDVEASGDVTTLLCKEGTDTLVSYSFAYLFNNCSDLTKAPKLPATTLASNCYDSMFQGCTGLTTAPELPVTTLAEYCYYNMFYGCTSLTTIPELPATTLERSCYSVMFFGCTGIKLSETRTGEYRVPYRIPSSGTGTIATNSLNNMFTNTGGTFTGKPSINTTYYLYKPIYGLYVSSEDGTDFGFVGRGNYPDLTFEYTRDGDVWTDLLIGQTVSIPAGGNIWIRNTNPNGSTFSFNPYNNIYTYSSGDYAMQGDIRYLVRQTNLEELTTAQCFANVFAETGITSAPTLPYTTLVDSCYSNMFQGCTGLTTAPELPATTLAERCYAHMFQGCTGLTTAPELPATTLASYCYDSMFNGCTGLTTTPELPAITLAEGCYEFMFINCSGLTSIPELPATTLADNCYYWMFFGCSGIALSATMTEEYNTPYRIPSSGTGTSGEGSLDDMFGNTGGTFIGTPTINTVYYVKGVQPLSFTANTAGSTFQLNKVGSPVEYSFEYSSDMLSWTDYTLGTSITLTNEGDKIFFRNKGEGTSLCEGVSTYYQFVMTGSIALGGEASTLLAKSGTDTADKYAFYKIFKDCTALTKPASMTFSSLGTECCWYMYQGCTNLTSLPVLPALKLGSYAYDEMFSGCTSICISETQDETYVNEYRIPNVGDATQSTAAYAMFKDTGGTFTGKPNINKIYYTSNLVF